MMLFLTRHDIQERKAKGCREADLYSKPSLKRLDRANELIREITEVFKNVRLGNGIGLFEANAIDDCEPAEARARQRSKDEKEDWSRITSNALNTCYCSLSFFDSAGMRFHLPAYMCCDLKGEYGNSLEFSLTNLSDFMRQKFLLFSPSEKSAVASYLEFLGEDANAEFSHKEIEKALRDFWKIV